MTVLQRLIASAFILVLIGCPQVARAQCDLMIGPVVRAARVALELNDVTPLLVWVMEAQEDEVRRAFEKTMAVRRLNAAAQELADRYFLETVARLHRAGVAEPFTGLKDAADKDDLVESAEEALESGVIDHLVKRMTDRVAVGIRERFARAMTAQESAGRDVAAGRRYVATYIEFRTYIEALRSPSQTRRLPEPGPLLPCK